MNYKIGDKVKIRGDLVEHMNYGENTFEDRMLEFLGEEVTIASEYIKGYGYNVKEDDGEWGWTKDMFMESGENHG
jgi:hypothetical protein